MVTRKTLRTTLLGRDVAVAYAVLIALYLARFVQLQPLQIPAYLLVVAYDLVEVALPVLNPYHPVLFPMFLYLLAVLAAAITRYARDDAGAGWDWRRAAGSVALIVGAISLLFGAVVGGPIVSATDNPTPLAITGATGLVLLAAGWWLLDRPTPGTHRSSAGETG